MCKRWKLPRLRRRHINFGPKCSPSIQNMMRLCKSTNKSYFNEWWHIMLVHKKTERQSVLRKISSIEANNGEHVKGEEDWLHRTGDSLQGLKNSLFVLSRITDKLTSDGQIRFREHGKIAQKCPSDRQCCVQMSIGWTVQCLIVHWLDSALSSCPSDGQCSVKLSIGWTVLCPTVHWMDSALSNCSLDGQCSVQLSIRWTK